MPSVLIRNVDEALHRSLKASAASHRRSLEEEARELLRAAVAQQDLAPDESVADIVARLPRENLADAAARLFGPEHGVDLDIPPRGSGPRRAPPDFSDH